jgi:hypothetical protein
MGGKTEVVMTLTEKTVADVEEYRALRRLRNNPDAVGQGMSVAVIVARGIASGKEVLFRDPVTDKFEQLHIS